MYGITTKVGLEFQTSFLFDPWIESIPLKDWLHLLFMITEYIKGDVGMCVNETLIWNFKWMRLFFVHLELVVVEFLSVI